ENHSEPNVSIAGAHRNDPVILVERDHANWLAAKPLADGRKDLQHLHVLLASPGRDVGDAPGDLPSQDRREDPRVLDLCADTDVPGGIRDRAVRGDEAAADDTRHDDALTEEVV